MPSAAAERAVTQPLTVYVVDDHPVVRAGLRALLADQPDINVVGEQSTAVAAIAELATLLPAVVITDIHLPDRSGVEVCRAAKLLLRAPRVILLSAFWNEPLVAEAFAAGADGYLLKHAERFDIVNAVRAVARGEKVVDPELLPSLLPRGATSPSRAAAARLTERERQLLALIARGYTNPMIAQELYLSPHTVKEYVSRVLEKVGASNRTELIVRAMESGLIDITQASASGSGTIPPIGG